jgi:hypothetical protein
MDMWSNKIAMFQSSTSDRLRIKSKVYFSQAITLLILTIPGYVVAHSTSESNRHPAYRLRLSLRGGATNLQQPKLKTSASIVQLHPDEQKPDITRVQSVLALNEVLQGFLIFPLIEWFEATQVVPHLVVLMHVNNLTPIS